MKENKKLSSTTAALSPGTALRGLFAAILMVPLAAFAQIDADLSLTLEPSIETVFPGTQFEYQFSILNSGPGDAEFVGVFSDFLPAELNYIDCLPQGAMSCGLDSKEQRFVADFATLPSGLGTVVTLIVELDESTPPDTTITLNAGVNSINDDPDEQNNSDSATITAASSAEPLTFHLHGFDISGTADGFTMDANPPSAPQPLALNLINAPKWYSESALSGNFAAGDFELSFPCSLGIGLATTYALHRTDLDGSNPELMTSLTQLLQICSGMQTITIPTSSTEVFDNERLRLKISTLLSLSLTLDLGEDVKLVTPEFEGNGGADPF